MAGSGTALAFGYTAENEIVDWDICMFCVMYEYILYIFRQNRKLKITVEWLALRLRIREVPRSANRVC
jgi:hypothetical protein